MMYHVVQPEKEMTYTITTSDAVVEAKKSKKWKWFSLWAKVRIKISTWLWNLTK